MKAIVVQQTEGNPLVWADVPAPKIAADEVLVDVFATALNRADLMQRAGNYPPPPGASDILGLEMAGRIAALGSDVSGWQVGDRVCALLPGGGYAEQVAVPADLLIPVPDDWTFAQAAAVPEVFLTAYVNLFMEAELQRGEKVLIHGGASGVGTAAIQLAHHAGCAVATTAGSDEKTAFCRELGADVTINYRQDDFLAVVREKFGGVDVILDMVGANYFERNVELLNTRGRIVFIAAMSGAHVEVNLWLLLRRRLKLIGSVLRARSVAEKIAIKNAFMVQFWDAMQHGEIRPVIDSIFPISRVEEAHQRMAENKNIGKIVLKVR